MEALLDSPTETAEPVSSDLDVVRSWKDPRYRRSLSAQQLEALPEHPCGTAVLAEQELKAASGLIMDEEEFAVLTTSFDCTSPTFRNWKSCGC
jgi:mersacidin/lichenicidin family type 2 lantibiotic